ncbi:unnamed protein product [Trichobilharzia szidati]|nr:unnamed protein product [Trichobilharzia szidati]
MCRFVLLFEILLALCLESVSTYSANRNQGTVSISLSPNFPGVYQYTVKCALSKIPSTAETNGVFTEIQLSNSNPNGSIIFQCSQFGRAVPFVCNDKTNSSILFLSKSFIQCKEAPVVSVRPGVVRLLKKSTPFTQQLGILLSDNVTESPVVVTCQKKGDSDVSVSIASVSVLPGTSTGVISVSITSFSSSNSVTISCRAQSNSGKQYMTGTSEGASSNILLIDVQMALEPNGVNLYSFQFQVLLYLNAISRDLEVLCGVNVANSETQANSLLSDNTCGIASNSDGNSSSWTVTPYLNEFKVSSTSAIDSLSRLLTIKRNYYPSVENANKMEILILKCCSTTQSASVDPAFANIKTTARVNVLLQPPLIINKGDSLPSDQIFPYPDPAWIELSPCPCDLTKDTCDLGCSCDKSCPINQSAAILSGLFGGNYDIPSQHSCDSVFKTPASQRNSLDLINRGFTRQPAYHSLLCLTTNNTSVLGKYYKPLTPASSLTGLVKNAQNAKSVYPSDQVIDSGAREMTDDDDQGTQKYRLYTSGDPVNLLLELVVITSSNDPQIVVSPYNDYLVLPNDMNCDLESNMPVEYLADRSLYRCPIRLSNSQCQNAVNTKENIGNGWGPRKLWDRLFARAYLIDDLVVSKYSAPIFRLRMNRLRDNIPVPTEVTYFCLSQNEVQYFMISTQSTVSVDQTGFFNHNCTYNEITKLTTCIPLKTISTTTTTTSLTPSVCNWHNSFTFPPDVTYANNICNNVVLKVDYKFVYSNGSIVKAIAQVYLANLPVTTSEVTYYQEYSVKFIHTTEVDNEVSTKLPSHLYGYEMNDLLVVGKVTSSATQRFLVQTDNETNILSGTVRAGVDMLCDNAVKDQFKFGINVASSCRVLLGLNDFANCEKLRSLIIARLNQFVPSEVIAVYPQASNTLPEDWVFIQRKEPPVQTSNKMQNSSLIGICPNISSTIYLKIIYAIQGELQGIPLKQIISASIEYSQENWQLMCDTSNYPSLCRNTNTSPSAQNFYLTTVILFSEISSPSDEVLNSTRNCDSDTCWNDAFYAWTGLHKLYQQTGKIEQTFEIGVTLGISGLVLIIFFITRPFF